MFLPSQLAEPSLVFYSVRYVSFVVQGFSPGWEGFPGSEGLCSFSLAAQEGRRQGAVSKGFAVVLVLCFFIVKIDLFSISREWQKCWQVLSLHAWCQSSDLQRGWGCHWREMLQVGHSPLLQLTANPPAAWLPCSAVPRDTVDAVLQKKSIFSPCLCWQQCESRAGQEAINVT